MRLRFPVLLVVLFLCCASVSAQPKSPLSFDAKIRKTLIALHSLHPESLELTGMAAGVLVVPRTTSFGFVLGFQQGRAALVVKGRIKDYYSLSGIGFGARFGVKNSSQVYLFMIHEALNNFVNKPSAWKHGAEISMAFLNGGVGKMIDSYTTRPPVIGYLFNNRGIMFNLGYESNRLVRTRKK